MSTETARWLEYALGLLDPEAQRVADQELDRSEDARNALADAVESLSVVGEGEAPLQTSDALRASVLSAIRPGGRFDGFVDRVSTFLDLSTSRIRDLLATIDIASDPDGGWEDERPGARLFHFDGGPRVAQADCGLVQIAVGASFPAHRHKGDEWSFVLSGSGEEDSGVVWNAGDLVHRPEGSVHSFRTLGDEPFVFAVVLHGGIESPGENPGDHPSNG